MAPNNSLGRQWFDNGGQRNISDSQWLCKEQTSYNKFQRDNNSKKGQPLSRKSGRRNNLEQPWSCTMNNIQGPRSDGNNLVQRNTCKKTQKKSVNNC